MNTEPAAPPPSSPDATDARALTLDVRGWRCPMPVVLMEKALRRLPAGGSLKIIADDPVAAVDIPHFAAAAGFLAERASAAEGACAFLVRRNPAAKEA